MKIYISNDHAGYELKNIISKMLDKRGYEVINLGTDDHNSVDYPDYANKLAKKIMEDNSNVGIAICGSGIGISIALNRYKQIRAALCSDPYVAKLSKKHNNSNVLCMGARVVGIDLAQEIVISWLDANFEYGRHQKRVQKLSE